MKDKLLLDARRLFRFVAPAMAVLATGGCVTSLPSPPGITQVGPYEVRFGSMVPAPVAEIAEDPVGTLGKKANGMADSMFTQPIDDPFIFSVQANSWLQAFAGPNKVSGPILDGQNYYRNALGAWNNPWDAVFALRGR
jgi:hypothetical protein